MSRRLANSDVFSAIADPTRRKLLDLLGNGEHTVNSLAGEFDVTLSAISQQLRLLREVGLVTAHRSGRERRYRLCAEPLKQILEWVGQYERFWNSKLDALGDYLEKNR
jgi:DNA-binding transcriptional ArsR family regulator